MSIPSEEASAEADREIKLDWQNGAMVEDIAFDREISVDDVRQALQRGGVNL